MPNPGKDFTSADYLQESVLRFEEKYVVDGPFDCWVWTAGLFSEGYGQFRFANNSVCAHRWVYEVFVGPIPKGLELDHLCHNRLCVRLDHLQPKTHRQNVTEGLLAKMKPNSSSQYTGVSWHKGNKKWRASICINSKRKYLGLFTVEEEARDAYQAAKNEQSYVDFQGQN